MSREQLHLAGTGVEVEVRPGRPGGGVVQHDAQCVAAVFGWPSQECERGDGVGLVKREGAPAIRQGLLIRAVGEGHRGNQHLAGSLVHDFEVLQQNCLGDGKEAQMEGHVAFARLVGGAVKDNRLLARLEAQFSVAVGAPEDAWTYWHAVRLHAWHAVDYL